MDVVSVDSTTRMQSWYLCKLTRNPEQLGSLLLILSDYMYTTNKHV